METKLQTSCFDFYHLFLIWINILGIENFQLLELFDVDMEVQIVLLYKYSPTILLTHPHWNCLYVGSWLIGCRQVLAVMRNSTKWPLVCKWAFKIWPWFSQYLYTNWFWYVTVVLKKSKGPFTLWWGPVAMEMLRALQICPKIVPCKFRNHVCVGPGCEVIKDFAEVPYHGRTLWFILISCGNPPPPKLKK